MKRFLILVMAVFMVLSLSVTAFAATGDFALNVQCTDEDGPLTPMSYYVGPKVVNDQRVQVKYSVTGGSNSYTNFFSVIRASTGTRVQSKFVNVSASYLPIIGTAEAIKVGDSFKLTARGNTKHYDYDGVSRVTLEGTLKVE